jgi:hypothetical protein
MICFRVNWRAGEPVNTANAAHQHNPLLVGHRFTGSLVYRLTRSPVHALTG